MVLLQSTVESGFGSIILLLAGAIIVVLITRFVFSIPAIVRNLEEQTRILERNQKESSDLLLRQAQAQTRLLAMIAEKQGVSVDAVRNVYESANGPL